MRYLCNLMPFMLALALIGCHGSSDYHQDHESTVSLVDIDVVDSYGNSGEDNYHTPLSINPYLNNGVFDIYWLTYSSEPYYVEFLVGGTPNIHHANLVYTQICDGELDLTSGCGELASQSCFYTPALELLCGGLEQAYRGFHGTNIGNLIYGLPQQLYFFVQVCEEYGDECEYDYRKIVFE